MLSINANAGQLPNPPVPVYVGQNFWHWKALKSAPDDMITLQIAPLEIWRFLYGVTKEELERFQECWQWNPVKESYLAFDSTIITYYIYYWRIGEAKFS